MAAVVSAGMVLCRRREAHLEVLIAHPGGPFFARKDVGAWSIPKGLVEPGEEPLEAAIREVQEELGVAAPSPPFVPLGVVRFRSGKWVHAWAVRGELEPSALRSNEFELEWPPRSGQSQRFPELDRVQWVTPEEAIRLVNPTLVPLFERVEAADVVAEVFGEAP